MRKSLYLLFLILPILLGIKIASLKALALMPMPEKEPIPATEPTPGPIDPPSKPPAPPPVISTCAGAPEEDFPLEQVRITFYTAKRSDAGTQQPIFVTPLGGSLPPVSLLAVSAEDSKTPGRTDLGSVDRFSYLISGPYSSRNLSKMKISLGHVESGDDPWFLGGLLVEGLKQGCDSQDEKNWTAFYFNPVVKTWITSDAPLIVSEDDVVAIFGFHMGFDQDAFSPEPDVYVATPFEKDDNVYGHKTPRLNDPNTYDFIPGTYYYGRTYFAVAQVGAIEENTRLIESFSDLKANMPGDLVLHAECDCTKRFNRFETYLIRPQFHWESTQPFLGYSSVTQDFRYPYKDFWSDLWIPFGAFAPYGIPNFGEAPVNPTARGFFEWAIQYDNPGWRADRN